MYDINNRKMTEVIRFHYKSAKEFSGDIGNRIENGEIGKEDAVTRLSDFGFLINEGIANDALFLGLDDSGSFEKVDPLAYLFQVMNMLKKYDPINKLMYQDAKDEILNAWNELHPVGSPVIKNE